MLHGSSSEFSLRPRLDEADNPLIDRKPGGVGTGRSARHVRER